MHARGRALVRVRWGTLPRLLVWALPHASGRRRYCTRSPRGAAAHAREDGALLRVPEQRRSPCCLQYPISASRWQQSTNRRHAAAPCLHFRLVASRRQHGAALLHLAGPPGCSASPDFSGSQPVFSLKEAERTAQKITRNRQRNGRTATAEEINALGHGTLRAWKGSSSGKRHFPACPGNPRGRPGAQSLGAAAPSTRRGGPGPAAPSSLLPRTLPLLWGQPGARPRFTAPP